MGITGEIGSVEIDFEGDAGREDSIIKETVDDERNNQRTIKIEISTAIFIYRQHIKYDDQVTVEVIPFHQIKDCTASLKKITKNK